MYKVRKFADSRAAHKIARIFVIAKYKCLNGDKTGIERVLRL